MKEKIKKQILESSAVKETMAEICVTDMEAAAKIMIDSIKNGGKILWCGNGGSASDAQHLATELMGGMTNHERKPMMASNECKCMKEAVYIGIEKARLWSLDQSRTF